MAKGKLLAGEELDFLEIVLLSLFYLRTQVGITSSARLSPGKDQPRRLIRS
jgi:hypothetical protein